MWRRRGLRKPRLGLDAAPGSIAGVNEPRTLSELPPKWRKLTYQELEVFDTSELRSLQSLLEQERVRVTEQRAIAKEQQRKVLRVECDLDLKRIAKIEMWLNVIFNDKRRTW
ncbi:hypothetical protein Ctob_008144 [Chrysochromulina tobinii]|uniref:Uncharacterized protein n=1 Tax=Chrysochromulina tobinii TaxID=1460289 RepID=A0A0M0JSA8_9EUKA|nr:hypothetical protein Ctob_008144 [Chrysochromulina tobinii]|eukprot:KOO29207.1 hypothetical protein Ctob_008144 [Chrysochromulina sp. CCMP291]